MKYVYKLIKIIKKRIKYKNKKSYSYFLYKNPIILTRKIMEEAYELCLEIKENFNKKRIISEFCDLFYHSLISVLSKNISISDIEKAILSRMSK